LGPPDNQELSDEHDMYEQFMNTRTPFTIAPVQTLEWNIVGIPGRVLRLTGEWATCRVDNCGGPLMLHGVRSLAGMAGSPIVNDRGHAIGAICTGRAKLTRTPTGGCEIGEFIDDPNEGEFADDGPHANLMRNLPSWFLQGLPRIRRRRVLQNS
jgi:hypothetical protein